MNKFTLYTPPYLESTESSSLGEVDVDGSAAVRPGPAMLVWVWKAHRTWLAVVCSFSVERASQGVATMDSATFTKFSCITRERPRMLLIRTCPSVLRNWPWCCPVWCLRAQVVVVVRSIIVVRYSIGVFAMTTGIRLIGQPRLGVVDPLTSCIVLHGGVALDHVVPDLIKRESEPILPGWRPHHASVPEDVGHAGKEEDRQHLRRDHLGLVAR